MYHKKYKSFKEVGHVDVDAGLIWIGDPCYILKDEGEPRAKDFGEKWSDIVGTFFDRCGYNAVQEERWDWHDEERSYFYNDPEAKEFLAANIGKMGENDADFDKKKFKEIVDRCNKEFREKFPFTPKSVDTSVASFKHDSGYEGKGVMMFTNSGDGTYPVYIKYGRNGRPSQVLIDFGDEEPW